jgi:hypothetical protein
MKKLYNLLFLLIALTALQACKKDSKPVTPQAKTVGKWNADYSIDFEYFNGIKSPADTVASSPNAYVFTLNADGSGNVYVSGKKAYVFNYTIADNKINYTNFKYYNSDGSQAGVEPPYSETIITSTDTKLATSLEQDSSDASGNQTRSIIEIYFTKIN